MRHPTRIAGHLAATLSILLTAAGCDCSGDPTVECDSAGECGAGLVCRDGLCEPGVDGGPRPDAAEPPLRDSGPRPDGGAPCPGANRCGSECCDESQECVGGARCEPVCETGARCGPEQVCCGEEQLCIADACVTPGDACTEAIDCPLDAFCDQTFGRCLPRAAGRCEYFPEPGMFLPEQQWAWTGSDVAADHVNVMMAPAVGDLDGDGVPEVVFNTYSDAAGYTNDGVLRAARGDTGEETLVIDDPRVCPEHGVALGDLDGDGTPEIVTSLLPCGNAQIVAFAPDGTELWRSHMDDGAPFSGNFRFGASSIADFEGDGAAEVVIGGAVLEADGTVRWAHRPTAASNCCGSNPAVPLTAVYDADGDGELEVVAGNAVWNADGTAVWEDTALVDGFVAVADFFDDGVPDVVVVHQEPAASGVGHVSIRRGTDGAVLFGPVVLPGGGRGGPPTVADFDGDGLPEIGVAGATAYAVFDPDGEADILWQVTTQDGSSNITGSSVFDFDGDGRAEVVYNDECYMRVYAGADGTVLARVPQNSHTLIEYPLIVDVDADGNAEIVFAANSQVNRCSAIPDYTGLQAGIRVFRDGADNWVGTRSVWNQHTYHITNVRQDLSVPAREQPNWRRFNSFRQNPQSFDAPNLVPASLSAEGGGCPARLELTATVRNEGAVTVGAGLPVSFYLGTGDAPGRLLATVHTAAPIPPGGGETLTASPTPMASELGRDQPWFVRVDDAGDGTGDHNECVETDNVAAATYDCSTIE